MMMRQLVCWKIKESNKHRSPINGAEYCFIANFTEIARLNQAENIIWRLKKQQDILIASLTNDVRYMVEIHSCE